MFKNTIGVATVALLVNQAEAVKLSFRPIPGSVPWHKAISRPSWENPSYPHGYTVPNFGEDRDMSLTAQNLKKAEKEVNHTLVASFASGAPPPDYRIPDFGVDNDVVRTQRNIKDTEKELGHSLTSTFGAAPKIASYPVPNFGVDTDIITTQRNIKDAETDLGIKYTATFDKAAPPSAYAVPGLGPDADILATTKNLKAAEKTLGKWNLVQTDSQVDVESDPICSSAGCTQFKHKTTPLGYPIDYPVPSFGKDPEIESNANSVSIAEAMHNHKLVMGTPESKAKWHNVAKDTLYNYAPELDEDMKSTAGHLDLSEGMNKHKWVIEDLQLNEQSDPICSSAGCTQYAHKKTPLGYPIDYPVPSFGSDPEIDANAKSVSIAEAMHNHKLIMGTPESKAKWHNVAKDTLYDYAPELDEDMKNTAGHLGLSEGMNKHKWVIEDVQLDSDPICSSAGCWKSEFTKQMDAKVVQYPDPEAQGLDSDVQHTIDHEQLASGLLSHKWTV